MALTVSEDKLINLLHDIMPDDKNTALYYMLLCRRDGLTEKLVKCIEQNDIKEASQIEECIYSIRK